MFIHKAQIKRWKVTETQNTLLNRNLKVWLHSLKGKFSSPWVWSYSTIEKWKSSLKLHRAYCRKWEYH